MSCVVTNDLNRHLRDIETAEAREEFIQYQAEQLGAKWFAEYEETGHVEVLDLSVEDVVFESIRDHKGEQEIITEYAFMHIQDNYDDFAADPIL